MRKQERTWLQQAGSVEKLGVLAVKVTSAQGWAWASRGWL
jgi:hypothetical protein